MNLSVEKKSVDGDEKDRKTNCFLSFVLFGQASSCAFYHDKEQVL